MLQTPWYYGWNVVGLTVLFQAVTIGILIYCFALFVVPWLDAFDARRGTVMSAVTLMQLGVGLLSPLLGRAMDRYGMRRLVLIGATALALGLFLASRATALWQVIALYGLAMPFAMVLSGPLAAQTLVTRWFAGRRGMALGISAIGTSLGGFAFPFITSALIAAFGWREALVVLSVLALATIVPLGAWILSRSPPAREDELGPGASQAAIRDAREWRMAEILRAPMFWLAVCAFVPINAAFGSIQFNLGAYVQDLGLAQSDAALLISLSSLCMVAGKFLFGSLADRLDHRWLYGAMAAGMGAALLVMIGASTLSVLALAAMLMGLAGGGILTLLAVVFGSRFGARSFGRVMGLAMMFITLAALGPLIAGWIHDLTGSYDIAFAGFALLLLPAMLAMSRLPAPGAYEASQQAGMGMRSAED